MFPATGPAAGGSPTPSTPPPAQTPEPQAPSPQEASSFSPSLKPPSKPLLWGRPLPHLLPSLPRPCSAPRDLRATKPARRCPLQLSLSPWGSLVCRCPTRDPCPAPSDLLPTARRTLLHPLTCQRSRGLQSVKYRFSCLPSSGIGLGCLPAVSHHRATTVLGRPPWPGGLAPWLDAVLGLKGSPPPLGGHLDPPAFPTCHAEASAAAL